MTISSLNNQRALFSGLKYEVRVLGALAFRRETNLPTIVEFGYERMANNFGHIFTVDFDNLSVQPPAPTQDEISRWWHMYRQNINIYEQNYHQPSHTNFIKEEQKNSPRLEDTSAPCPRPPVHQQVPLQLTYSTAQIPPPQEPFPHFHLLEPLRDRQRKSYRDESRFLTPKPVIVLRQDSPLRPYIMQCMVSVRLANQFGATLPPEEQSSLVPAEGRPQALLDLYHCRTPPFSFKIDAHLRDMKATLIFLIEYVLSDQSVGRVEVASNVFHFSRKKKNDNEKE
ncbi:hypothetical protein PROFUN_00061 [Planoprotostelium fungivorum]|uniref:Uncharacterized protein n=1 Tax=Planoprotostelium fungivorum TaxID=1890364 RepID=A0A2P6P0K9_9EUKA|nr:hypothetical protein PROFUN_00061 [Planoprotostelium fungivorum]